jgi:hypothetical protein
MICLLVLIFTYLTQHSFKKDFIPVSLACAFAFWRVWTLRP